MTGWRKRTIMEMAREAGFEGCSELTWEGVICTEELEAFAAMVREDEREACAKLAAKTVCDVHIPSGVKIFGTVAAKAIRARGQA